LLRRSFSAFCVALALLALPAAAVADPALPPGFQDELVFGGLEQPTNFRFAPDGRVFVAEKAGRIWVYENLEDDSPALFADLRSSVYDRDDRGLLGLELDPEFTTGRPYVYALYTWDHVLGEAWNPADPRYGDPGVTGDPDCPTQNSSRTCLVSGRLVRLTEDSGTPGKAEHQGDFPKEEELLQGWCQQFSSHSIGELQFGPEGALYVSGGDGAAFESIPDYGQLGTPPNPCGDPPSPAGTPPDPASESLGGALRSQNPQILSGAILRLDPDTGAAFPGNPLGASGDENSRRTIAKGLRNPFRFAIDVDSSEIYSGNVGSEMIEEIDRFPALPSKLHNSGWPCFEGTLPYWRFSGLGLDVCEAIYDDPASVSSPFFTYSHGQSVVPEDECPTEAGSAVGGISPYEGNQFPAAYEDALFFGDAVRGCIWVMFPGADGRPDPSTTERFMREGKVYPGIKIAEGPGGYLYYASFFSDEGLGEGEIRRIAYRPNSPRARLEAEPSFGLYDGSNQFETTLDAGQSSDPNGDSLTYEWDLEEDGSFAVGGSQKTVTFTKAEQEDREGNYLSPNRVVAVRVKDGEGFSSVARVTVYPGDKPPSPTIVSPGAGLRWSVGDEISLAADALDASGNPIDAPMPYYWETRLAHCPDPAHPGACHVHPLQTFAGLRYAKVTAPQHEYPSFVEVILRVSDDRGLSGTASLKLDPRTVDLSLRSEPPGVRLLAGSTEASAPFTVPAIDGSEIFLSAPPAATLGSLVYSFVGWSDGEPREHPIKVSSSRTDFTASYGNPVALPLPPLLPRLLPPPAVPNAKLGRRPAAKTMKRVAVFSFSSTVSGAGFRCRLDGKPMTPCRSPRIYRKLKPGRHTFRVWATAGVLTDPTPAMFSWRVLPPKRR
jgi:glucose/arabinose dehydrogenase